MNQLTLFGDRKQSERSAVLSDDNLHRYILIRKWDDTQPCITFIGLNPSRADHQRNDPTTDKLEGYAKREFYGSLQLVNLYSWRSPKPRELIRNINQAIGPECDRFIRTVIKQSQRIVVMWGSQHFKAFDARAKEVLALVDQPYCFGTNNDGQPKHPLFLAKNTLIIPYKANGSTNS